MQHCHRPPGGELYGGTWEIATTEPPLHGIQPSISDKDEVPGSSPASPRHWPLTSGNAGRPSLGFGQAWIIRLGMRYTRGLKPTSPSTSLTSDFTGRLAVPMAAHSGTAVGDPHPFRYLCRYL